MPPIRSSNGSRPGRGGEAVLPKPTNVRLTATDKTLLAEWDAVPGAISYDVHVKQASDSTWDEVATGVVGLSQTVADLNPVHNYDVAIDANQVVKTRRVVRGSTLQTPNLVLHRRSILQTTPQNAMFQDREPIESGYGDIPAAIAAPGRTLHSNFSRLVRPAHAAQHMIYGMRFALGNMTTNPISGGKMIVSFCNGNNGMWSPRINGVNVNDITENVLTGWERVRIGGDPLLPIPGAVAGPSGQILRVIWTDWVKIPAGILLSTANMEYYTRFLLPPRASAPYALTHGAWHPSDSFARMGVLAARSRMRYYLRSMDGAPIDYHYRGEGDYVTDPAAAGNITTPTGNGFCPATTSNFTRQYGPDGFGQTPILAMHYATSPEEIA